MRNARQSGQEGVEWRGGGWGGRVKDVVCLKSLRVRRNRFFVLPRLSAVAKGKSDIGGLNMIKARVLVNGKACVRREGGGGVVVRRS